MSLFRRAKAAAVLGCGPAGLFAAHAIVQKGWEVDIFSNKRRSEMFGAQYLHRAIPGLDGDTDPKTLDYTLRGSVEDYRRKVYGNEHPPSVSPQNLVGTHQVWDIRRAYYDAWEKYQDLIHPAPGIDHFWLTGSDQFNISRYRFVIVTIPRPTLCTGLHQFWKQEVWAMGDAPERGKYVPFNPPPFTVICNGEDAPAWYRASNIYGYTTLEWPEDRKPPINGVAKVVKPLRHNCSCLDSDKFVFAGRYGAWDKGYLSHMAYQDAMGLD